MSYGNFTFTLNDHSVLVNLYDKKWTVDGVSPEIVSKISPALVTEITSILDVKIAEFEAEKAAKEEEARKLKEIERKNRENAFIALLRQHFDDSYNITVDYGQRARISKGKFSVSLEEDSTVYDSSYRGHHQTTRKWKIEYNRDVEGHTSSTARYSELENAIKAIKDVITKRLMLIEDIEYKKQLDESYIAKAVEALSAVGVVTKETRYCEISHRPQRHETYYEYIIKSEVQGETNMFLVGTLNLDKALRSKGETVEIYNIHLTTHLPPMAFSGLVKLLKSNIK